MNLLEHSLWWLLPAAAIAVFMVFAMMEYTAALLVRPSRRSRRAVEPGELRQRLLALNERPAPYRVVEGKDSDLELRWDVVDASWHERFAKVKLTTRYRARMLLDELRNEVRWFESIRSSSLFLGFEGWRVRFNFSFYYRSGYLDVLWSGRAYGILPGFPPQIGRVHEFSVDTRAVKKEVTTVIRRAGWSFRPVVFPPKMSRRWLGITRTLSPAWLTRIPERRLWGTLYAGSFLLFYLYVFVFIADAATDWTWENGWPALLVGLGWWGIWGFLAWMLAGFPRFWRRRLRGS